MLYKALFIMDINNENLKNKNKFSLLLPVQNPKIANFYSLVYHGIKSPKN